MRRKAEAARGRADRRGVLPELRARGKRTGRPLPSVAEARTDTTARGIEGATSTRAELDNIERSLRAFRWYEQNREAIAPSVRCALALLAGATSSTPRAPPVLTRRGMRRTARAKRAANPDELFSVPPPTRLRRRVLSRLRPAPATRRDDGSLGCCGSLAMRPATTSSGSCSSWRLWPAQWPWRRPPCGPRSSHGHARRP